jgi:PAS domain S-box-containing protein
MSDPVLQSVLALDILDSVPDAISALDFDFRYLFANTTFERISGKSRRELVGRVIWDVFPQSVGTRAFGDYQCAMRDRTAIRFEAYYDQLNLWLETKLSPSPFGLTACHRLTDDRKKAEQALVESENRYRKLIEFNPDAIFINDGERILYSNAAGAALFGAADPSQLIGMKVLDVAHPDDRDVIRRRMAHTLGAEGSTPPTEFRLVRVDGSVVEAETSGHRIIVDGKPLIQVVARDISRRKTAERALLASEQRYRLLVENAQDVIFRLEFQPSPHYAYVSPAVARMMGYTPEECYANPKAIWDSVHPEDKARFGQLMANPDPPPPRFELRVIHKQTGEVVWTEQRCVAIRDASGAMIAVEGFVRDITEQKLADRRLRENETMLRRLADVNVIGIFHADVNQILYANDAFLNMVGYTQEDLSAGLLKWRDMTPPEYLGITENRVQTGIDTGIGPSYEKEYIRKDGTRVPVLLGGAVLSYSPLRSICFVVDLTHRKQAEAALRAAHDELEDRVALRTAELAEQAERNRRLVRELEHRVRNNLAALISLNSMMRRRAGDVATFADAMEGRLMAMAHIQSLLTEANWGHVQLRALITSALSAMKSLAAGSAEATIHGPPVRMPPASVMPLTLVLVEWFTNAVKYGALSRPGGRIDVNWTVNKETTTLTWAESGGPTVDRPIRPSLGTELVNSFVTRELKGRCEMRFPPEGARHTIEFPGAEVRR